MELGRFEEALHCYDEALSMENENDAFICNKGVAFLELGSYNDAIECFRKTLVINPSNEDARILKDECLENL
jgi:tetratricopeptide (TPR) repeat protein